MSKYSILDFIEKAKNIHNDKYDYNKVKYLNSNTKVEIICKEHGSFLQRPHDHLGGHGCFECSRITRATRRLKLDQFISKAISIHGNKYDYGNVKYVNNCTKVELICKKHGAFFVKPNAHISMKSGCPTCASNLISDRMSHNTKKFIDISKKIHGDRYDYSNVDYKDNKTKVHIICQIHGSFLQSPNGHKSGNGCPRCKESKGETRITKILQSLNIEFVKQYRFEDCKNKSQLIFDFYLPCYNMCIEFDGSQHYNKKSRFYSEITKTNDEIKDKYCLEKNIYLLRIPYYKYINIEKIIKEATYVFRFKIS